MTKPSSLFPLGGVVQALALGVFLCSATACFEPKSVVCPRSGRICSMACSADGETCITNLCGNGVADPDETCDDGNIQSGDGCSFDCRSDESCGNNYLDGLKGESCDDGNHVDGDGCSADCRSKESCGNKILDPEEQCDDGNDNDQDDCRRCVMARCGDGSINTQGLAKEECDPSVTGGVPCNLDCTLPKCGDGRVSQSTLEECDSGTHENTATCDVDCTVPQCGDGYVNPATGEECDDGNTNNDDGCLSTCRFNRCGDGFLDKTPNHEEACDDGNRTTETACPYGSQSCWLCNADCSAPLKLRGPHCGDGIINGGETCDDGNTRDETGCSLGTWNCRSCSADCSQELDLSGNACGNGHVDVLENCDDGNAESCGSCNAYCTGTVSSAKATGLIKTTGPANFTDSETFTLNDGLHPPVVFEFDKAGGTLPGRVPIDISTANSAEDVANFIAREVNHLTDDFLVITATASGKKVTLVNQQPGGHGNQPISDSVYNQSFTVTGMSGGKPYGCPLGTGCKQNEDCAPGLECVSQECTVP